jgi:TonB family protein
MISILHLFLPGVEPPHGLFGFFFTLLLEATLKGTLLLSVAAALALALRRASAASRHLVWTLALSATLILPALSLALPAWNVPIFSSFPSLAAGTRVIISGNSAAVPLNPQISAASDAWQSALPVWILFLWVVGLMLLVARMAVGEVRVRRLSPRSPLFQTSSASSILENAGRRLRVFQAVELRTSTQIAIPFTRGIFRPAIILPEAAHEWSQRQLEFVLAHELAHVRRHDCLTQVLAQLACTLFWFHPLVWIAAAQMRKERECACDDVVLSVGHRATDYAEFLLAFGRCLQKLNPTWSTTVAMAQPSQLEVRMKALLDSQLNHRLLPASRVLFAAVFAIALLVPAAVIHASAKNETVGGKTGIISGTVLGPGQTGASGARVALVDMKTSKEISESTNEDGRFEFPGVPAGGYRLEITKPGFAPTIIPGIEVAPSRSVLVYVNMSQRPEAMSSGASGEREHRPQRIKVSRKFEAKKLVYGPSPQYPPLAKMAGIQGTVKLDAIIAADGTIKDLRVESGHPLLVKAALDSVKDWRYKPTLLNGDPIEVETTIAINFTLAKESH